MLRQILEYCFPKTCQVIRDEVHKEYHDLGVRKLTRYHKFELPKTSLKEGTVPKYPEMKVSVEAYILGYAANGIHCIERMRDVEQYANTQRQTEAVWQDHRQND
jgi:hypothetical protein